MSSVIDKTIPLSKLKRDAHEGRISLEMTYRYGKTGDDIPERLRGIRAVCRTNSVAIFLQCSDGVESELRLTRAALIKYTGESLSVYAPAERDPNDMEKSVLEGWEKLQEELEQKYPYSDLYWKKKEYFKNSSCCYMSGFESSVTGGKSFNPSTGKVRDKNIPGIEIIRYTVYHI